MRLCNENEKFDPRKIQAQHSKVLAKKEEDDENIDLQAELDKPIIKKKVDPSVFNFIDFPSEGRQVFTRWRWCYPDKIDVISKTFFVKYEKSLSAVDKILLNNFQKKYLYHAIDDILYTFKFKPRERDNLLAILYSPVISLQNNIFIDFFDIWIDEISINKVVKDNKFLTNCNSKPEPFSYITIKLLYSKKRITEKPEPFW